MDAIILAGGLGTRLRPAVSDLPKCMAPVCGKPFLHYVLSHLNRFQSVKKVILSLGYKSETIVEWIEQLNEFKLEYVYSVEDEPLGTGGAIKKALNCTNEKEVLILNGDTLFDIDLEQFAGHHSEHHSPLSIALKPMEDFDRYGNVEVNDKSVITDFGEKTRCLKGQINGGIYLLSDKNLTDSLPEKFSFELEVLQPQASKGSLYGFIYDNYFIDIGIPEDYVKANREFNHLFSS